MASGLNLFIHCFPPARGGSEYLAQQFVSILRTQYSVHIFTGRGQTLDSYKTFDHYLPPEANPNIHRLPLNQFRQRIYNRLLSKLILRHGYFSPLYFGPILQYSTSDLQLISQSQKSLGIAMPTKSFVDSYKFAKKYQQRLTLIPAYHNVNYYNHCPEFQRAFDYASTIFYLTPFEKNQLLQHYHIDKTKLIQATFCPFTDKQLTKQSQYIPDIFKKHLSNYQKKHITLGFIGQITLRKNLNLFKDYLDKYLPFWQSHHYLLKVYLAGAKTNSSDQVENMFKQYLDQEIVSIKYGFSDQDKEAEFSKIDIFINPSLEESLGIVNFEALFFGCHLLIRTDSAFDSLTPSPPTFYNPESLHRQITSHLKHPIASNLKLLQKYSLDRLSQIVLKSI